MVKPKVRISAKRSRPNTGALGWILFVAGVLTFAASWLGIFPTTFVEKWYARSIFPIISIAAEKVADAVAFSWLDVAVPVGVVVAAWLIRRRRWKLLLNVIAAVYLFFFWTWGLNYHRQPLASKLPVDSEKTKPDEIAKFTMQAAAEINRLYVERKDLPYNEEQTRQEANSRVEHVVKVMDGTDWNAPHRIKISWVGDSWFHAAGVDGMFNPAGQEPLISNSILDIERPFVESHELAHVRGYPDEGDANVIAALATLLSKNPSFQYSGWLSLWLYLRTRDRDKVLDPGPRQDMQRIFDRARSEQIQWISSAQRLVLDWFLKANHVEQGVRSYSRIVLLTAGTQPYWDRFR
jgi:Protein of unknown function (DUF3810)